MTLDELVQLFANVSAYQAEGYPTGFHAGIAAVLQKVAGDLLRERGAKNADLVQLLNRLVLALDEYDNANPYHDDWPLIARAREVADEIERDSHTITFAISGDSMAGLKAMCEDVAARKTAEESVGRRKPRPTDEQILDCRLISSHVYYFESDLVDFAREVLARLGGGEELA